MKKIFSETFDAVKNDGARVNINFQTRSLKVNGKYIIKNGEYEGELDHHKTKTTQEALEYLEVLYQFYKHSRPSERSESRRYNYFRALPEKDLSSDDMLYGMGREEARCHLELVLLTYILNGSINWDDIEGGQSKWFWQSQQDKDFIILKSWVVA